MNWTLSYWEKHLERNISIVMIGVYSTMTLINVISRALTGEQAIFGALSITLGLFIWVAWLSAAYVVRLDGHLRFSFFRQEFSNRLSYVVYWIEWLLWIAFAAIVFWFSIPVTTRYLESGAQISSTPIPQFLTYLAIPIGFGLILLRIGQKMVSITRRYMAGEDISIEEGGGIGE